MALYMNLADYDEIKNQIQSNTNDIRSKAYYEMSPKFVKAFNKSNNDFSYLMGLDDTQYNGQVFRFLQDIVITGRVYLGTFGKNVGVFPNLSKIYTSYTYYGADNLISPSNPYTRVGYVYNYVSKMRGTYVSDNGLFDTFTDYPYYTNPNALTLTDNNTLFANINDAFNDNIATKSFDDISNLGVDITIRQQANALTSREALAGLVECKTKLYVIAEDRKSFAHSIDIYFYVDIASMMSNTVIDVRNNDFESGSPTGANTSFSAGGQAYLTYRFNSALKELGYELTVINQVASSSQTLYHILPKINDEKWYEIFSKYLGIRVSFSPDDYLKPVDQWTFGNKEVDIDDRDVPGSGGQDGGETGGGEGTGDNTSEPIDLGKEATGTSELTTSYALSYGEVEELNLAFANGLLWKQILNPLEDGTPFFSSPSDVIINLVAFPFNIAQFDEENVTYMDAISILGVDLSYGVGEGATNTISGYKLGHNMKTRIPMGSLEFKEFFGSFLDYDPYTKITLYLPFFGYVELSATAVMGKKVEIFYNVSYLDGTCLCVVLADNVPIMTKEGNLGYQIPIIKSDNSTKAISNITSAIFSTAGGVKAGITSGDRQRPIEENKSGTLKYSRSEHNIAVGVGGAIGGIDAQMNNVQTLLSQSTISYSGSATGVHARAMSPIPFVIITRPITNMPNNYNEIAGYQTNLYRKLNDLTGFTSCANVKLDGVNMATEDEKSMIKSLLSNGVIL